MDGEDNFFDILYEISNEDRYRILLRLNDGPGRVTKLARNLKLGITETSRHISRLCDVGLARRDPDGSYQITPYGELVIKQLRWMKYSSKHRDYFNTHSISGIPYEFVERMGELLESMYFDDVMGFLHGVETIIEEEKESISFLFDRYPVTALPSILEALDRGVKFRIIKSRSKLSGPHIGSEAPGDFTAVNRVRTTPLVEQRTQEMTEAFLLVSENMCALAFPTLDSRFDYRGFTASDDEAMKWCRDLYQYIWERSEPRVSLYPTEPLRPSPVMVPDEDRRGEIVVVGHDDVLTDAQAVQDAVDNFDKVILRGNFNFGNSKIVVQRSVVIRGEGRENDFPSTNIYKEGWPFPSTLDANCGFEEHNFVFLIDGEGVDATIENIHFTDFNYACIGGSRGNSMKIRNNRITLETGLGRGDQFAPWGDIVVGIKQNGGFPGGVEISGNYLDFALSHWLGGYLPPGLREDPSFRPNLLNHENYIGFGINMTFATGKVLIENNVIRNINNRAISVSNAYETTDVKIRNNTIVSEVYGSYWFDSRWAGFGIAARCAWFTPSPGFNVEIIGNTIRCEKLHYCGIGIIGPEFSPAGFDKLKGGVVEGNHIQLGDGSVGILVESCDGFEIVGNTLSGEAYYGIGVFPQVDPQRANLGAKEMDIADNDMENLEIRDSDDYCIDLFDERSYVGTRGGSATAHVWLNVNTKGNVVKVNANETVVDEGEGNIITYVEK